MDRTPNFQVGEPVWYIENSELHPRKGTISQILTPMDKKEAISYVIDDDDMIHAVVRHKPFIFTNEKECKIFAKRYRGAINELLAVFFPRANVTGPVDMAQTKSYLSDVIATLHGRTETLMCKHIYYR